MGQSTWATTNPTSTKSTRNTTLTTKDLSSLTTTGTDKSTNGALRLLLVLKKSSSANTQDTTKTQNVRSSRSHLPRIKSRIAQWKLCSEQMVYKVKANWERCLASRKSKLSVFTTCLYG